ncbi:MAG TPA: sugar transferase [Gemmatimonadales bacterium]|jgi:lipopolysaccharide/colanic/teichoic acid biosynthesis glycosyltransferase|nr:sugar transferase [Gemmatimonadales bacterium]
MRTLGGAGHPSRDAEPEALDWDSALPRWRGTLRWKVERAAKVALDRIGALVLLVLLAPVLAVVGVLIRLDSPGSILHPMDWVGYRGRRFRGYKLRTMVVGADEKKAELLRYNEMTGPVFKMRNDPRITRLGRFLRRTSLDELPQLWSVLKGDMSLVGPRPPMETEYAGFEPWQKLKLAVTPGMTCTWQVSGRSAIARFDEWIRLDLEYVNGWSFWLDLKLLLKTIPAVLGGRGAG